MTNLLLYLNLVSMTKLLLVLLFFASTYCEAVDPALVWVKQFTGDYYKEGKCISLDNSGNVYTAGFFGGTVDFDPGPDTFNVTGSSYTVFLSKLNNQGEFVWVKTFAAKSINSISIFNDTSIYLGGTDGSPNHDNSYVEKRDSSGNLKWIKRFDGVSDNFIYSISTDSGGNVYSTGCFHGLVDFDPGIDTFDLVASSSAEIFVSKLNSDGELIWAKQMTCISPGSGYRSYGSDIIVDKDENICLTGSFNGTVDFDSGQGYDTLSISSGIINNPFVCRMDSSGNLIWAFAYYGSNYSSGNAIAVDDSNNYFIGGHFSGLIDFNTGQGIDTIRGDFSVFITKVNSFGDFQWAKAFINGLCSPADIAIDSYGDVYTIGAFTGNVDFDPGSSTRVISFSQNTDGFLSKLNKNGNYEWVVAFAAPNYNPVSANAIWVDDSLNVYSVGDFYNSCDFDPGTGSDSLYATVSGFEDIFIHKMGQPILLDIDDSSAIQKASVYPNPGRGLFQLNLIENSEIKIYNSVGQVILEKKCFTGLNNIDICSSASGLHIMKIKNEKGAVSYSKLIKE